MYTPCGLYTCHDSDLKFSLTLVAGDIERICENVFHHEKSFVCVLGKSNLK